MKRVVVQGETFTLKPEKLSYYDGYVYGDDVYEEQPDDTEITGYIKSGNDKLAYCVKSHKKLYMAGVVLAGVLAVSVIGFSAYKLSGVLDVEVPHFSFEANHDDEIGELDDGVVKTSSKLTYSQYATYNGSAVAMYIESKDHKAEVQLAFGDDKSEFVPVSEAYSIPIHIDMQEQDVLEGVMLYKKGDSIKQYPVTVEYLINEVPELQLGEDVYVPETIPYDIQEETVVNDINEYQETDIDYENYNILTDDPSADKERMLNKQ